MPEPQRRVVKTTAAPAPTRRSRRAPARGVAALALWRAFTALHERRALLFEMMRREFLERHAGHAFGIAWTVLSPLLTVLCYVLVFGFVFQTKIRIANVDDSYVVFLLAGLAPWLAISDMLGRAPSAISGNPGFVKQMVFPIEVLPARLMGPALVTQLIATLAAVIYAVSVGHSLTLMWALMPFAIGCQYIMLLGLTYLLSAVGVFFRDIREITALYLTIGLLVSPILYQLTQAPPALAIATLFNPISPVVLVYQDIIIHGTVTYPWAWIAAPLLALAALHIGYASFTRLRSSMSDAL